MRERPVVFSLDLDRGDAFQLQSDVFHALTAVRAAARCRRVVTVEPGEGTKLVFRAIIPLRNRKED